MSEFRWKMLPPSPFQGTVMCKLEQRFWPGRGLELGSG